MLVIFVTGEVSCNKSLYQGQLLSYAESSAPSVTEKN